MHEHEECEHQLKYCKVCDVVYCTKCKKEWGQSHYTWGYTTPTYTIQPLHYSIPEGTARPPSEQYPIITCQNHNHQGEI